MLKEKIAEIIVVFAIAAALAITFIWLLPGNNGLFGGWFQASASTLLTVISAWDLIHAPKKGRIKTTIMFILSVLLVISGIYSAVNSPV